jgi:hypothetical protein
MNSRSILLTTSILVLFCIAGCGDPPPKVGDRARVSGKVTLDTKALTTGTISFEPVKGGVPVAIDIVDGNYEGKAPVGENVVRFTATRKINMKEKMKIDGPGYDQLVDENLLPDRYTHESKLKRDVEAGADNKFNFDLLSK